LIASFDRLQCANPLACALLLLLFNRGTNLRHDIGTGPPGYGE
jgi:hypothetical protein